MMDAAPVVPVYTSQNSQLHIMMILSQLGGGWWDVWAGARFWRV